MTDPIDSANRQILVYAKKFVALVRECRIVNPGARETLHGQMNRALDACEMLIRAEKDRRLRHLASHICSFVRDRKPFNRHIDSTEAEAVRLYYATPPALTLSHLSGEDLISLADHFEGWSHDARLDQRAIIELQGWSDGVRMLANAVGMDYEPLPIGERIEVPLLKFIANRTRSPREP